MKSDITIKLGINLESCERIFILATLNHCEYNLTQTAKVLGIAIRTLHRKLDQWNLRDLGRNRQTTNTGV